MQYALLIYENENAMGKNEGGAAFMDILKQHIAFSSELRAKGIQTGGAGLKGTATATTVRQAKGTRTVHDGPFAESKEQLGGFYLIDVPDLDAAIDVARRMPLAEGGSIEIRPVLGPG
jgi:hypothetical protein